MTRTTRLWISCWVALAAAGAANIAAADPGGNPYSFYGSVGECAAAERERCTACLADNACGAITPGADGVTECHEFGADGGRGYHLICINLSLAIDAVATCVGASAAGCAADTRASESLARLDANSAFLDNAACAQPLDACLASVYGPSNGHFPGPGSDGTTVNPPRPRHTAIDCGDSCNGDANCDDTPDCELDGTSCDAESDTSCSDASAGDGGGCSDSGGGAGDGGCDSEDSCGSEDSSSCDSSDCGGGGNSDCGGGGGGGDCSSGGGGDCSGGGGGDCSGGGGGDCNVTSRHGRAVASLPVAIGWALLPVPFAMLVRRRARRRRAHAQRPVDAAAPADDREVAP